MSLKTTGPSRIAGLPKRVAHLRKNEFGRPSFYRATYPPSPRPPTTSTTTSPSPSPTPSPSPSSTTSSSSLPTSTKARLAVGLPPRSVSPHPRQPDVSERPFQPSRKSHQQSRLVFDTGAFGIPKSGSGTGAALEIGMGRLGLGGGAASQGGGCGGARTSSSSSSNGEDVCERVGEDAYFRKGDAIGIADGVGGWKAKQLPGADAGRFSALLMSTISDELPSGRRALSTSLDSVNFRDAVEEVVRLEISPVEIMQRGFEKCLEKAGMEGLQGSSTALLALLRSRGEKDVLRIANVGDCCLTVVRKGSIIFQTEEMQHRFNCPYQLGTHEFSSVPAADAKVYDVAVEKDDVIVLCSDGLVDNLFDEEMLEEIKAFSGSASTPRSPQRISEALCSRAKAMSENRKDKGPFGEKAKVSGLNHVGGKRDDISVIVAIVGDPTHS